MKKIFLSIITCIFTICNVYASLTPEQDKLKIEYEKAKKEQIANLVETIKNAPAGSITSTNIPTVDDCTHTIVNKDNVQIFYEQVCFPIDLRFKGFDPVKNASYIFTIYNGTTKNTIAGDYKDFQELLSLIPSPTPPTSKQKETFGESCDKYKFDVVWKDGESISVAYNYGQEDKFVSFQRIFNDPDKETSVYLGDNNEIFMYKDGEWKNYGNRCTPMEQKSYVHECDPEHKIKIVWYEPNSKTSNYHDDFILVYKMQCDGDDCKTNNETPTVFLFDKLGFPKNNEKLPQGVITRVVPGQFFKNNDLTIWHGRLGWDIDDKLCKNTDIEILTIDFDQLFDNLNTQKHETCDPGFEITSQTQENVTIKYDYDSIKKEFTFPKIFDDNGTKVYFGSDSAIFINNNDEWKNRGHRCTPMEQKSYVHECDPEHKIKIVWYAPYEARYYNDDIILVYKQVCTDEDICKNIDDTPTVFLRTKDPRPTIEDLIEGKVKWIEETNDVSSGFFINNDTIIRHDYWHLGGEEKWLKLDKLCKFDPLQNSYTTPNFNVSCDEHTRGFYTTSETKENLTVEYYDGTNESQEHVFPKIFDDNGVKVYFGGDNDIFINNNGEWKNYGHPCTTEMEYKTVTQQCGKSGKIKIVWYQEKKDPYILADLKADADPWGFSDVILVYKMKCDDGTCKPADKAPLVFLREGQGTSFKNAEMMINLNYGEFEGNVKWKIDSKLCKSIPDCLKSEVDFWNPIEIKYIGRYPGQIDGYTDVDVYGLGFEEKEPDPYISSTYSVRPRFWAVHGDKLVRELDFDEGVDVLKTIRNPKNIPEAVKKAAKSLTDRGFDLVYVGRYPGEFDGYTDVDIYHVSAPAGTRTGFPILYAVRSDKIIKTINGFESLEILRTVLEKDSDSQTLVKSKTEPVAPVSDEEVISKLVDTIKNAPSGLISATNIPTDNDCRHIKLDKDGKPFLYERACFSVGLRLKGFDPVKFADYRFTVYNDDGTETEIKGDYKKFKELIAVIPEPQKKKTDTQTKFDFIDEISSKDKSYFGFETLQELEEYTRKNTPVYVEKGLSCKGMDNKSLDVRLYRDYAVMCVNGKDIKLSEKEIKSKDSVEYSNNDNRLEITIWPWLEYDAPLGGYKDGEARSRGSILNFYLNEKFCKRNLSSGDNGLIDDLIDDKTEQKLRVIFE